MKSTLYFTVILSAMLIGCGGDENASAPTEVAPIDVGATEGKKKASPRKQKLSVEDRIDDAIAAGNYDSAARIAIGTRRLEMISYAADGLRRVKQSDAKAQAAYRKLNMHYDRINRR